MDKEPKKINKTLKDKPNIKLRQSKGLLSTALMFLFALVIAFLLTTFIFQQYQVDGPSMQTTLFNGNRLIVVKYQRTWARITGHPYIPGRGSIIIFNENGLYNAAGQPEKQLVKRVIGLPGDHIVIKNGMITIYNKQHPKGFDPDKTLSYYNGKTIPYTSGTINLTLPANEIFVCGDNRTNSLDSRVFGPINVNTIVGKLDMRIYPFNSLRFF
ncbi:MAG TPA: signal peptidase I [Candidatus Saccharimonadia bacterium]|nr:signal peptidase I [Candidatus Saccharimonadia bacterium]